MSRSMARAASQSIARLCQVFWIFSLICTGCQGGPFCHSCGSGSVAAPDVPRELNKVSLPEYVIEPPDILQIEAVRIVPLPPYHVEPLDSLAIYVTDALPQQPIQGVYPVDPDGTINLGFSYGSVRVVDQTIEGAKTAVENHLKQIIKPGYQVNVSLAETRGKQLIR